MTVQDESATSTATHGAVLTDAASAKAKAAMDKKQILAITVSPCWWRGTPLPLPHPTHPAIEFLLSIPEGSAA